MAQSISLQAATVGVSIDPEQFMPGGVNNVDEARKRQAEIAERQLGAMVDE